MTLRASAVAAARVYAYSELAPATVVVFVLVTFLPLVAALMAMTWAPGWRQDAAVFVSVLPFSAIVAFQVARWFYRNSVSPIGISPRRFLSRLIRSRRPVAPVTVPPGVFGRNH